MFFFVTGAEVKQVFAPVKPFYTLSDIFSKALQALYIRCIRAGCELGLGQTKKFLGEDKSC